MAWLLPVRCPMMWEEFRRRMRGGRGFIVLAAFGLALMAVLIGVSLLMPIGSNPQKWSAFGHKLWVVFLIGQLIAMVLLGPGMTASAISIERERRSLDHFFLTPMSTLAFVWGKFFGAIGQLLLVMLSGMPIVATVFAFGGVSPQEVLIGYLLILASGFFYTALGFLASCLCARVSAAVALAYGSMLFVLIGMPLLTLLLALRGLIDPGAYDALSAINPLFAYLSDGEQIWQSIAASFTGTLVLLAICTLLVARLRGGPLWRRRTSLATARHLSRRAEPAEGPCPPIGTRLTSVCGVR